ncbi:hypothetical protein KBB96_08945 [Luteolibacter ambystomatis]|uniref:Uncharacterized protein n=1 Tax=Luteolibacter ambystomatis TaxID=2824561 RepID=A0A975PGR6_9BACT|nr:hypothetical protein [Luteolibacter ambystomatis]QUE53004.1 hypothetical protein KBB96_08945 [Luteolibacter ambystomatis]
MARILCFIVVIFGLVAAAAWAGPPSNELDPKVAARLIGLRGNLQPAQIEIGYIVDGSSSKDGFEAAYVRRVAAIHPVLEGGAWVRRVVYYDLFWNDSLGWFMSQNRTERGGDAIYRWSERGGATVVK